MFICSCELSGRTIFSDFNEDCGSIKIVKDHDIFVPPVRFLIGKCPVWSIAMMPFNMWYYFPSYIITQTRLVISDGENYNCTSSTSMSVYISSFRLSEGIVDDSAMTEVDGEPWYCWSRRPLVLATELVKSFSIFFVIKFKKCRKIFNINCFQERRFHRAETCGINIIDLFRNKFNFIDKLEDIF